MTDTQQTQAEESTEESTEARERKPHVPKEIAALAIVGAEEPKFKYDADAVNDFVSRAFPSGMLLNQDGTDAEHILVWEIKEGSKAPSFPMSLTMALRKMRSSSVARPWYFGTSAMVADTDGNLRNRQSLFSGLHFLVLDDIGTKVRHEDLPETFREPSYIIESSRGNHQYGLVLKEPIEDLNVAKALIQLVFTAGVTDSGGKMPNKLVRLPCGVNGKEDEDKIRFPVTLKHQSDRTYTPEEILNAIDASVTWAEVVADPSVVDSSLNTSRVGAMGWNPVSPPITTDGATDVVLDWFEANDLVKSYNGEWVTVQCPWHKSHTTGEDTAGYSPLGYGEGQTRNFRGFHCFHEHCGDRHAADLIDLLVDGEQIPFHVPVYDPVWQWKVKLVLDVENSKIIDLTTMERLPLASFSVTRPHVVIIDEKKVPLHKLYLNSPDKLQVSGSRYAPSETWPIFKSSEGLLHVNSYHTPRWGTGAFKQEVADVFINHLKYLCPTPEEFAYVMNWILCKAHNPKFRGNAIIMYAPAFGTGRDTLVKMLEKVFHSSNIVNISSKVLLDPNYNMFLESQFVVCNELTDGARDRSHYRAFEHLKDLVDPQAKHTLINRKYEKQYMAPVYSSFLMFTNHNDAVKMAEGDRRFYVVSNPTRPAPPSYFQSIHASLNDPSFGMHVWRWLKTQTPDYKKGEEPVPMTAAKEVMLKEADSPEVIALREFLNVLDCDIVVTTTVIELIEREPVLAALFDIGTPWGLRKKQLTKALKGLTKGVDRYIPAAKLRTVYSETSTLTRYRVMSDAGEWIHGEIKFDDDRLDAIEDYRLRMAEIAADRTAFVNEVVDAVNALDNY